MERELVANFFISETKRDFMLYNLYTMRRELQSQNRVDVNYEKTVGLEAFEMVLLYLVKISFSF